MISGTTFRASAMAGAATCRLPRKARCFRCVGQPMLAHKAVREGKVAAGRNSSFDVRAIPSVAYTDPEVVWVGLTENEAKAQGVKYGKGVFPWTASGRSLSLGRDEGVTKMLFDENHRTNALLAAA